MGVSCGKGADERYDSENMHDVGIVALDELVLKWLQSCQHATELAPDQRAKMLRRTEDALTKKALLLQPLQLHRPEAKRELRHGPSAPLARIDELRAQASRLRGASDQPISSGLDQISHRDEDESPAKVDDQ